MEISKETIVFLEYETGLHDREIARKSREEPKEQRERKSYLVKLALQEQKELDIKDFCRKAKGYSPQDISKFAEEKKELLLDYFPKRFSPGSSQNISEYSDSEIGALFRGIYNYYKKKNH